MVDRSIIKLLSRTASYFNSHSFDSARLIAELRLAHCLCIKRLDLYLQYDRLLQENELSDFKTAVKRKIQKEPLAYITGKKGFFESDFNETRKVLIPRPDTETIVEQAIKILNIRNKKFYSKKVLELGTGSGAIIVSLAKALPNHLYFASDICACALETAKKKFKQYSKQQSLFFCRFLVFIIKTK